MDKIYSVQDVKNVIAKVEDLAKVNADLEELLYRGSNDEKLVERKRELQNSVRKFRSSEMFSDEPIEKEQEEDLALLKADYEFVISRYKARKLTLEAEISIYKNGG